MLERQDYHSWCLINQNVIFKIFKSRIILITTDFFLVLITTGIFPGIFDRDQSGTINFQEFQQLWQYINQWKGAFDRYDQDRSGAIEGHELHRAFAEMGFNVSANFVSLVVTKWVCLIMTNMKYTCILHNSDRKRKISQQWPCRHCLATLTTEWVPCCYCCCGFWFCYYQGIIIIIIIHTDPCLAFTCFFYGILYFFFLHHSKLLGHHAALYKASQYWLWKQ